MKSPRPLTESDLDERAQLLTDEGHWRIDTRRPAPTPGVPRPGTVRRIPTRPTLITRVIRFLFDR